MTQKKLTISLALLIVLASTPVDHVQAEASDTALVLMPHCTEVDRSTCPSYPALDATTLRTEKQAVGDIIDLDIVLRTAKPTDVETVRAWLSYDATVLEARSIELAPSIKAPLPGEQTIVPSIGLVKIGADFGGRLKTSDEVIARVTFRVITAQTNTLIAFHHFLPGGTGETAVNGKEGTSRDVRGGTLPNPPCFDKILGCAPDINALLFVEPSKLQITLVDPSAMIALAQEPPIVQNTSTGTPTVTATTESPALGAEENTNPPTGQGASPTLAGSAFSLLQVQNLGVTSRDRDVYIGWMALRSSEIKGYNVYYSTVSGRYAQRHSLPSTAQSYTLRDLEPGTTYFIAIRAFNQSDTESAFSQEVSVTVGKPESSTAPLSAVQTDETEIRGNPIETRDGTEISGETGTSSVFFMVLLVSSALGTAFAFHRNILLHRSINHV